MRSIKLPAFRLRRLPIPICAPVYGLSRTQLQNLGIWTSNVAYDVIGYRYRTYLKYVG